MKIDKEFAVKVEGKVFTGTEIDKITIDGGKFNMICTYVNGSKFEVSAYTKDVELLNAPHVPEFKRIIDRNITPNTFRQCTSQDDMKPVNINNIKQAVREVIEAIGKDDKRINVSLSIDGKQFSDLIKKYNQDITRSGG